MLVRGFWQGEIVGVAAKEPSFSAAGLDGKIISQGRNISPTEVST
jgi:hypothetical protein